MGIVVSERGCVVAGQWGTGNLFVNGERTVMKFPVDFVHQINTYMVDVFVDSSVESRYHQLLQYYPGVSSIGSKYHQLEVNFVILAYYFIAQFYMQLPNKIISKVSVDSDLTSESYAQFTVIFVWKIFLIDLFICQK